MTGTGPAMLADEVKSNAHASPEPVVGPGMLTVAVPGELTLIPQPIPCEAPSEVPEVVSFVQFDKLPGVAVKFGWLAELFPLAVTGYP